MTSALVNAPGFAFNPLTQVAPYHAMWASDPLWTPPADGAAVSSMRNASGGGDPANATSGEQPLYRASVSALFNRPAVEFDGVNDTLAFDIANQVQPFKALIVGRFTSNPSANLTMVGWGPGATQGFGITSANRTYLHNASQINPASGTVGTAGHVWRCTCNNTSSQYWQDGTSVITGTTGTGGLSYIRLGSGSQNATTVSRWTPCQLAFVGYYDGATSDTDLAALAADLKTYYGL